MLDVFAKFKDEEGGFEWHEPRDMLSLYNAAHLRTHMGRQYRMKLYILHQKMSKFNVTLSESRRDICS